MMSESAGPGNAGVSEEAARPPSSSLLQAGIYDPLHSTTNKRRTRSRSRSPRGDGFDADDRGSSSTEGPDSPGGSSSSSPVPLMLPPASPYHLQDGDHQEAGEASGGFSEVELQNQLPRYHIKVSEDVTKDADSVRYRIKVRRLSENPEEVFVIERQYEDFEYLHHVLTTQNDITGLIVPPLPSRPAADPKAAEARSQRQLGAASRSMRGDDFSRDAKALEKYLHGLLLHPVFGMSAKTADFLESQTPPQRAKIKKGLFSGVRQSLEFRHKQNVKDEDDCFQKERDWASAYGAHLKDMCEKFQNVIHARLRLSNHLSQLSTCLNVSVGGHDGANAFYNRLNSRFSGCLEQDRLSIDRCVMKEDKTLGCHLSLWSAYLEAENAMLLRRTMLMTEKDSAAKAFTKASKKSSGTGLVRSKLEQLRITKEDKESDFESVSTTATNEIKRFHQRRILEMKDCLVHYTEGQIEAARAACDELSQCVLKLREFPLPKLSQE